MTEPVRTPSVREGRTAPGAEPASPPRPTAPEATLPAARREIHDDAAFLVDWQMETE